MVWTERKPPPIGFQKILRISAKKPLGIWILKKTPGVFFRNHGDGKSYSRGGVNQTDQPVGRNGHTVLVGRWSVDVGRWSVGLLGRSVVGRCPILRNQIWSMQNLVGRWSVDLAVWSVGGRSMCDPRSRNLVGGGFWSVDGRSVGRSVGRRTIISWSLDG